MVHKKHDHPRVSPLLPVESQRCVHLYPLGARPHEVDGEPCWCDPEFLSEHDGVIIIHNDED